MYEKSLKNQTIIMRIGGIRLLCPCVPPFPWCFDLNWHIRVKSVSATFLNWHDWSEQARRKKTFWQMLMVLISPYIKHITCPQWKVLLSFWVNKHHTYKYQYLVWICRPWILKSSVGSSLIWDMTSSPREVEPPSTRLLEFPGINICNYL